MYFYLLMNKDFIIIYYFINQGISILGVLIRVAF